MKQIRPYQQDAINAIEKEFIAGTTRQIAVIFTGGGKTFTAIRALEHLRFKKILWLSFQQELISQSASAFIREQYPEHESLIEEKGLDYFRLPEAKIGCIKEDIFNVEPKVVMGSVMTIHRRLDRITPDYFDCIVADECHLFMSLVSSKVLNYLTPQLLLGLTATPHRADGLALSDIFQKITFEYGLDRGIRDGYCCELDAIRIKTTTSLDNVKTTAGEFNLKDLTNEVNTLQRNQQIVDSYKQYANGRQCIAFCVDIKHAIDLAEQFKMNGFDCEAVSSNEELTPDRSYKIKAFKANKLQIITNVGILTTGFDHCNTGALIMAAPTKSLTKYLQCVGRAARLKDADYVAKFGQGAIILDIVDSTNRHNLVNAWELDKEKDPEDRLFISQEKRDKLIAERLRKVQLQHTREKDEIVKLLSLPFVKISKSYRMSEDATPQQLAVLRKWGYNTVDEHYTKAMVSEIFGKQPCSPAAREELKKWGYKTDGFISIAQHQLAKQEYEKRKK